MDGVILSGREREMREKEDIFQLADGCELVLDVTKSSPVGAARITAKHFGV